MSSAFHLLIIMNMKIYKTEIKKEVMKTCNYQFSPERSLLSRDVRIKVKLIIQNRITNF
jgi:hypothetical protein